MIDFVAKQWIKSMSKIIISPPTTITVTDCNIVGYGSTISGNPQCTLTANGWEIVNIFNWTDVDYNP